MEVFECRLRGDPDSLREVKVGDRAIAADAYVDNHVVTVVSTVVFVEVRDGAVWDLLRVERIASAAGVRAYFTRRVSPEEADEEARRLKAAAS